MRGLMCDYIGKNEFTCNVCRQMNNSCCFIESSKVSVVWG